MKARVLLRQIHYWAAPVVLLPLLLVIGTGLLLMVKKEFEWIQPSTQKGELPTTVPAQSLGQLFDKAQNIPELELEAWADLERVDVKPDKGVVKFVASNRWEAQLDAHTGAVLQVAYRRSDLIESLHDGSFFADWTKHYVFLPSAIVLLLLWGTGIYLFVITQAARQRKQKRTQERTRKANRSKSAQ